MKKAWIILAVLTVFALVSTVSAFGSISFPFDGTLKVGYVGSFTASYNNQFGIDKPAHMILGFTKNPYTAPGTVFTVGKCSTNEPVVLYIVSPPSGGSKTYYSDKLGTDGLNHADVSEAGGVYTVKFEDIYDSPAYADNDFNDVIMNVTCTRDVIPTPEFPTIALPAALIVGIIGAVLFIQKSKKE
jgi:hypothetical protein